MGWRWVWSLGSFVAAIGLAPRDTAACSYPAPPPALEGFPSNGETGVPTDVVPFYDRLAVGIDGVLLASFQLESSAGDAVPVVAEETHQWTFSLFPERQLEPQTTYTLTTTLPPKPDGAPTEPLSLTFTTGPGPVELSPEPPSGSLQHYLMGDSLRSSCSPPASGTCVVLQSGFPVEAGFVDEFGQELLPRYLYQGPWFTNLSGIDQGTNFECVRLRSRAPNGTYSDPLDLCGKGAPLQTIRGTDNITCTSTGIMQGAPLSLSPTAPDPAIPGAAEPEAAPESRTSSACSFSVPGATFSHAGWAALLGLLLCLRRSPGAAVARRWHQ